MELIDAVCSGDTVQVRAMLPFYIGSTQLDEALIPAIKLGYPEMVEVLLRAGANPDVRTEPLDRDDGQGASEEDEDWPADERMLTPEEFMAERQARMASLPARIRNNFDEYDEYSELLILYVDQSHFEAEQGTVLIHACEGSFAIIDEGILIRDIDSIRAQQAGLLVRAQETQIAFVDTLIAAGADIEARDTYERTPLLAAATGDGTEVTAIFPATDDALLLGSMDPQPVIERLLRAGADVNACDKIGNTALMKVLNLSNELSSRERALMVRRLLNAGAEVNAQNRHGYTALLYASLDGDVELVQLLLDAGAEVDPRDENGFTPLHHVARSGDTDRIGHMLETIRMLLRAGADINARAFQDRTPLHIAGADRRSLPDVVRTLVSAGAAVDAVDTLGTTAYDLAVRRDNADVIPILARARRALVPSSGIVRDRR